MANAKKERLGRDSKNCIPIQLSRPDGNIGEEVKQGLSVEERSALG